jgi:hypothetical protein
MMDVIVELDVSQFGLIATHHVFQLFCCEKVVYSRMISTVHSDKIICSEKKETTHKMKITLTKSHPFIVFYFGII